jgi:hypothetical protein
MQTKTRITVVQTDAKSWGEAAKSFADLSYRQCPAYQHEAALSNKAKAEFILLQADGQILAVCALRVKTVPFLNIGVAYAHHGPLTMRNAVFCPAVYSECVDALADYYVGKRKLALRVIPPDAANLFHRRIDQCLENNEFKKLDRAPRHTIMVDLDRPLSAIRQSFDGKWRNHLRQSERHDLRVEATSNPDDFAIMATMLEALEKKKTFQAAQDVSFFSRVQQNAPCFEQLILYIGYYEGRPVSTHLCSVAGSIIVSLLAATNDEGREIKASRRMQWRVIEDAAKSGKRWYDTGGVDPQNNPGVCSFKKGMNGLEVAEVGLYERRPGDLLSPWLVVFERIYRKLRRISYRESSTVSAIFLWIGPASMLYG